MSYRRHALRDGNSNTRGHRLAVFFVAETVCEYRSHCKRARRKIPFQNGRCLHLQRRLLNACKSPVVTTDDLDDSASAKNLDDEAADVTPIPISSSPLWRGNVPRPHAGSQRSRQRLEVRLNRRHLICEPTGFACQVEVTFAFQSIGGRSPPALDRLTSPHERRIPWVSLRCVGRGPSLHTVHVSGLSALACSKNRG